MNYSELRIAFPLIGSPKWHGGITYIQNLIHALRSIPNTPKLFLFVDRKTIVNLEHHIPLFDSVNGIVVLDPKNQISHQLKLNIPVHSFQNHESLFEFLDFLYPIQSDALPGYPAATWIPDFQHIHLPHFFPPEHIRTLNGIFQKIANQAPLIVLSSKNVQKDFLSCYPNYRGEIRILHFHTILPPEIFQNPPQVARLKYNVPEKFLICCNQFWTHKNHITLFKALAILKTRGSVITLVCTGGTSDYRNKDFFGELQQILQDLGITDQVKILGMIPRDDQLQLLRSAAALVQPSLFEGWSTVVEDLRSIGLPTFLSDIAVHREQAPERAHYFNPHDASALAATIDKTWETLNAGPDLAREKEAQKKLLSKIQFFGKTFCEIAQYAKETFKAPKKKASKPVCDYKFKVSALVSIYNSKRFLRECMEDLCAQTLFQVGKLEILMVDTGSDEYECELIKDYLDKYPEQIQYYRSYDRKPLYQAWNIAIQLAQGQYLSNANTDDRHSPHCLEVLANSLDKSPEIDLVYADSYVSEIENETWDQYLEKRTPERKTLVYPEYTPEESLLFCQFGPQPMWRATLHSKIGVFSTALKAAGDWDFDIRFSLAGLKARHIHEVLGLYLQHDQAISFRDNTMKSENALVKEQYRTVENILSVFRSTAQPANTQLEKSLILSEMGFKALCFLPPWRYGRMQYDLEFAHFCFLESLKLHNQSDWSWFGLFLIASAGKQTQNASDLLTKISPSFQEKYQPFLNISPEFSAFAHWLEQRHAISPLAKPSPSLAQGTDENSKTLQITHLNTHDFKGGASKIAWQLNHQQVRSGLESNLLVGYKLTNYSRAFQFPQKVDSLIQANTRAQGRLYHEYTDTLHIAKHSLLSNSDILHFHNLHGDCLHPQALRSLQNTGKILVWTLHDLQSITGRCAHPFECELWKTGCGNCPSLDTYPKVQNDLSDSLWHEKKNLYKNLAVQLVVPSNWVAGKVKCSILQEKNITVIPNGIDENIFYKQDKQAARKKLNLPAQRKIALFIADGGVNNSFKGGAVALEFIRALRNEFPDLILLVLGQRTPSIIPISEKDQVLFIPFEKDETRIALYYNAADLFINPTKADTFSLSTCESMACGCPSLSFSVDAIPELITHNENGLLAASQNIQEFIALGRTLLENDDLRENLARNAKETFLQKFTLSRMVDSYSQLYQSLLSQQKQSSSALPSTPTSSSTSSKTTLSLKVPSLSQDLRSSVLWQKFQRGEQNLAWSRLLQINEENPLNPAILNDLGVFSHKRSELHMAWYYFQNACKIDQDNATYSQNFSLLKSLLPAPSFPTISLIIPNYNQGKYLEKCILSCLNQDYPDLQLTVIDGNSTDNSVEVIRKYEKHLHHWVSENDNGQSDAINKGLHASSGGIFNWICSDDYLEPGALFAIAQAWSKAPHAAAWVGAAKRILEENNYLHYISYPNGLEHEQIKYNFTARSFYQPACFMNMEMVQKLAGVREDLHYTMDYDLFVRLSQMGSFESISHILCSTLAQPDAKTVKNMNVLWEEKIDLFKQEKMSDAIANLEHRMATGMWNYVIPPGLNHILTKLISQGKLPQQSLATPQLSHCRNSSSHQGTYLLFYGDFTKEYITETLDIFKAMASICLERSNGLEIKITGPESERYASAFSESNFKTVSDFQPQQTTDSFCQAIIYGNSQQTVPEKFLLNASGQGIPVVCSPAMSKACGWSNGTHAFCAETKTEYGFKAIQISYEPHIWGYMSTHQLLWSADRKYE